MADIQLRFHKDMLVLSTPVLAALERMGIDTEHDAELTQLLEPDTIEDTYRLEAIAGAQCFVTNTASITPARLMYTGLDARADELANAALQAAGKFKPQHILVEIGPCKLPLDESSQGSLKEHMDQYARAGRLFANKEFDAFFLNGFTGVTDLKCALMGLRKVSDCPIFASVDVDAEGALANGRDTLTEAVAVMNEFEASVAGFSTKAGQDAAVDLAKQVVAATNLPVMVQLDVVARDARQQGPTAENPYYTADTMMAAADALRGVGVQFLRAVGDATPAYTGTLVATIMGLDAVERETSAEEKAANFDIEMNELIARSKARVAEALSDNLKIVQADGPQVSETEVNQAEEA